MFDIWNFMVNNSYTCIYNFLLPEVFIPYNFVLKPGTCKVSGHKYFKNIV